MIEEDSLDVSFQSETGEELVQMLADAKVQTEIYGTPMPTMTKQQVEKIRLSLKPTEDFFQYYSVSKKLLGQGSHCEGVF